MAALFGQGGAAIDGSSTDVDTTQKHTLGTHAWDVAGNEFVYLTGVTSTLQYSAVTYDEAYLTALTVADAVGPVAVAQAAVSAATKFGWYCVKGTTTVLTANDVADNKTLVLTSTAGKLDDADVAGDQIMGIWSRAAGTGASSVTCQLNYPMVHDVAFD